MAFALINGANDGGALLAIGLRVRSITPIGGLILLTVGVIGVPLLLGTEVATTLVERLVDFQGERGRLLVVAAVVAAVAVATGLAQRGFPTSLTLALVGGLAGAGLAGGMPVSWWWIGIVLLLAVAAPLAGTAAGFLIIRLWSRLPHRGPARRQVLAVHQVAFVFLVLAYGANDGQKMLAVLAVAADTAHGGVSAHPGQLSIIGVLFAAGAVVAGQGNMRRLSGGIFPLQPFSAVTAELSASAAVLGAAALGAPVSMTQTLTGAAVGAGLGQGSRRIRWSEASSIVTAWLLTMPVAAALAAALARVGMALA